MDKREFIRKSSAAAILASLGYTLQSCGSDDGGDPEPEGIQFSINDGVFTFLKDEGGWTKHPNEDLLLINVDGEIRAFSSVCPHARCTDDWTLTQGDFLCRCHGSKFSNDGTVIEGPATRNLTEKTVRVEGDIVFVS